MASAFEGERFLNAVSVNATTAGTHYTVPSGRYTKFYIQQLQTTTGTISIGAASLSGTRTVYPFETGNTNELSAPSPVVLIAGETISISVGGTVKGVALEFEDKNL